MIKELFQRWNRHRVIMDRVNDEPYLERYYVFLKIPVPKSLRPYQRINLRSMAQAPKLVRLDSSIVIRELSGTLTL